MYSLAKIPVFQDCDYRDCTCIVIEENLPELRVVRVEGDVYGYADARRGRIEESATSQDNHFSSSCAMHPEPSLFLSLPSHRVRSQILDRTVDL